MYFFLKQFSTPTSYTFFIKKIHFMLYTGQFSIFQKKHNQYVHQISNSSCFRKNERIYTT